MSRVKVFLVCSECLSRNYTLTKKKEDPERLSLSKYCPHCGKHFNVEEMEADHITPWHTGGRTVAENCQMLCRDCNRRKGGR